jgi:hypothetical protein
MTEVALRSEAANALVEEYPALDPKGEAMELITANIGEIGEEGLSFGDLDRLTVPSGGGTHWTVPDLEEGEITVKSLEGVMVIWETNRAFWESDEVSNSAPDCSSRDGKTPEPGGLYAPDGENAEKNPSGKCAECPMNQFGSQVKNGKGTQGKACKESKLLYMVRPAELLPTIVSLPPMSIRPLKSFLIKLATKSRRKYFEAVIALDLVVDTNSSGQKYSKVVPRLVRKLEGDERDLATASAVIFQEMLKRTPIAKVVAASETDITDAEVVTEEPVTA